MPGYRLTFALSTVLFGSCVLAASQEPGQSWQKDAIDSAETYIEEVVVIGTRRRERSIDSLPVPVDVLSAEKMKSRSGGDILEVLTSQVPSFNVAREPISDAGTMIRPANLRGLPADSTLILVNGKRRHRGAVIGEFVSGINKGAQGVDIAPIAGIAIKRLEVLRDGSTAQYGSDAIAGVLNFILEDNPEARRMEIQYGSTYEGDGDQIIVSGTFGTHLGSDGFATVSIQARDSEPTSRGSQDPQAARLIALGYESVPDPAVIWGSPKVDDDFSILFNAATQFGAGELYGFGNHAERNYDGSFYYRNPNTRSGVFADGAGYLLVADLTPDDGNDCGSVPVIDGLAVPSDLDAVIEDPGCFVFNEMFPGGFTPRFGGEVMDASITVGWRGGSTDGLFYDFSVSSGQNKAIYRIRNTVNASYGPNTPTAFNLGSQTQSERMVNADFTVPFEIGTASPLNIAFGGQYHWETFTMKAGDIESWAPGGFESQGFSVGSNGFQGFSADVAGKFNRDSYAGYLDLEADVTAHWLVSATARREHFSDFGSTLDGKLATRFEVTPDFALRASVSSGFRAPSIGQSSLRRAATVFQDGQLTESLTLPATDPIAVLKGGRQLQPEESVNWSLGTVFSFGPVDMTLDWFHIAVDDRIALTQQRLSDEDQAALLTRNIVGAETVRAVSFFVNDIDTRTKGLDFVAETGFDWAGGQANLALACNVTDTSVTSPGLTLSNAGAKELADSLPNVRAILTFDYARGSWSGLARLNYYSEVYEHLFNDETLDVTTGALAVLDIELTRRLSNNFTASAGVGNLFDKQPDKHRFSGQSGFAGADFPLNHPIGFNGAAWYLRLNLDPDS